MNIPFLDLRAQANRIESELREAIAEVFSKTQFILGPTVERFEQAFAQYVGSRFCIGLNNGTSALHMALLACNIGPDDEVITTPHTWISTSWAISYTGAKPVYVDIDPVTYVMDPERVEAAITPRTKAILPVHLYGQTCNLDRLSEIAMQHGLTLVEDAAQAHGAIYRGRRIGSHGKLGCFSFYPGKNLGAAGEAGAVVTDDEALAVRIRQLRDHAQRTRHCHVEVGYNTRMEGVQGAVLAVKLPHLDQWNAARRRHAEQYCQLLADVPRLQLPVAVHPEGHVWHLFVVLVPPGSRERLQQELSTQGIATAIHYPTPVPLQPAYAHLGHRPGDFPVAEDVTSRCLSLPMFPEMTEEQVAYVATAVRDSLSLA